MAAKQTKRGYKYRVLPTNDNDTFNDFLNDDSEFNMNKLDEDLEKLDDKVHLDGKRQQNFNFIENKVVQDGLVKIVENKVSTTLSEIKSVSFLIEFELVDTTSTNVMTLLKYGSSAMGYIGIKPSTKLIFCPYFNGVWNDKGLVLDNVVGKKRCVLTIFEDNTHAIYCDGKVYSNSTLKNAYGITTVENGTNTNKTFVYNRPLTPKEIQHNFTVLNNSPSINSVNVGDKKLLLSTDTDHVTDRTGRTQEQINRRAYKRMCKEFVSSGGAITVPNAEEGYVLSGKIEGQTVKNEFYSRINHSLDIGGITTFTGTVTGYEYQFSSSVLLNSINILKPNTVYTIIVEVLKTNHIGSLTCGITGATTNISVSSNGVKTGKITTPSQITSDLYLVFKKSSDDRVEGREISFRYGIYEGDFTVNNPIKSPQFGLSSTQAIINNNGNLYPIYEPTIQGTASGLVPTIVFTPALPTLVTGDVLDLATKTITFANKSTQVLTDEQVKAYSKYKKVILCNKVGDVADTFEIKEDGNGTWFSNLETRVLSKNDKWTLHSSADGFTRFDLVLDNALFDDYKVLVESSLFTGKKGIDFRVKEKKIWIGGTLSVCGIRIYIPVEELVSQDLSGLNQWLDNKGVFEITYAIKPKVTTLDKSIMPVIQTY